MMDNTNEQFVKDDNTTVSTSDCVVMLVLFVLCFAPNFDCGWIDDTVKMSGYVADALGDSLASHSVRLSTACIMCEILIVGVLSL